MNVAPSYAYFLCPCSPSNTRFKKVSSNPHRVDLEIVIRHAVASIGIGDATPPLVDPSAAVAVAGDSDQLSLRGCLIMKFSLTWRDLLLRSGQSCGWSDRSACLNKDESKALTAHDPSSILVLLNGIVYDERQNQTEVFERPQIQARLKTDL
jgi:hypothetical protein